MTLQRMEHVGIVVDDLAAATEFFAELKLELQGEASLGGRSVTASWGSRACGRTSRCPDGIIVELAEKVG